MNPELTHWTGPLGLPRFDLIRDEDFDPAFDACLKLAEEAVETIAANPAPPSFANTVAALETAEEPLNRLCAIFFTLAGVDSNPAREDLQRRIAPRLAAHGSKVSMDPRLFDRVEAVMQDADELAPEDRRLTELTLRGLRRAGAGLTGAARERMAAIRERLAVLSTDFAQNVLADERDFAMGVADDQLAGLPDWLVRAMRAAARERGMPGQVVTLNRSLIVPFLEYAEDRALREAAWRAWGARGSGAGAGGAATDNRPIAAEILREHEIERLLASPFTRTLQTAEIIADALKLPVEIEPLVHEHAAFICDIGTPAQDLAKRWPDWRFDHLPDRWWPEAEEEEQLHARCQRFWGLIEPHEARPRTLVVTHWGFIRALTGLRVGNGHLVRFTAPGAAELLHPREVA